MNVFYLHHDPRISAQMHCDKHVVKMCVEYAQILSTAHRVIDGIKYIDDTSGRRVTRWKLHNKSEDILYKATHVNHPSAVWARQTNENYEWLALQWLHLLNEYTFRYGKIHAASKLQFALMNIPRKIEIAITWSDPPLAMPQECKVNDEFGYPDVVTSYRKYYILKKDTFATWTGRDIPGWFQTGLLDLMVQQNEALGLYD